MTNLDKLIAHFEKFPGIGGRQAKRFAFHILTMPEAEARDLGELIESLKSVVTECASCHRFFASTSTVSPLCNTCSSSSRDHNKLMVVAHDSDINAIEKSGQYDGL